MSKFYTCIVASLTIVVAVFTSIQLGLYTSEIESVEAAEPELVVYEPISEEEAFTAYNAAYFAALSSSKGMDRYDEDKNEREAHKAAMQSMKTLAYRKACVKQWLTNQK